MNSQAHGSKLVSLTAALPYRGVDHAGGQYLLHHYGVLAERYSWVAAFAVGLDHNLIASSRHADIGFSSYRSNIVKLPKWRKTLIGKVFARVFQLLLPTFPDLGTVAALLFSEKLRRHLRDADIVELQWFEYLVFSRFVRYVNPSAEIIGVVHDVPSQRIERNLPDWWPTALRRVYMSYVVWLERWTLRDISNLAAHSPKDAELLAQRCSLGKIAVLNPPMELDWSTGTSNLELDGYFANNEAGISFGFVGALRRPENDDAGLWLLREIWPRVLDDCPFARLYIVGSRPSIELQDAAMRYEESVCITGYVENLEMHYDLFDTAVIPLRHGAGIKLKTVSAILAGKNIVATPVAVEGTLSDDFFFCVSESSDELAKAIVRLARNPDIGREVAEKARSEAGARYSRETYIKSVQDVYPL